MKAYERVGKSLIRPLLFRESAFRLAEAFYTAHGKNFAEILFEYLSKGYVVARPNCFGMARPIIRDGVRGWFIEIGVGEIGELLTTLPCPLAFVAFCRDNDDDMRVIRWDVFVRHIRREATKNGRRGQ